MKLTANPQLTFQIIPAAKLPPPPERSIHIAIADLLRASITPGWIWFHVPNGEYRSKATGALLQRMGERPGVSDFILIAPPNAMSHALELKRQGYKPTPLQAAFLAEIKAAGGPSAYAASYNGAKEILRMWGAIDRVKD